GATGVRPVGRRQPRRRRAAHRDLGKERWARRGRSRSRGGAPVAELGALPGTAAHHEPLPRAALDRHQRGEALSMDYREAFAISASGMDFEKLRMDAVAANLANMNAATGADGARYRPLRVVAAPSFSATFTGLMHRAPLGVS